MYTDNSACEFVGTTTPSPKKSMSMSESSSSMSMSDSSSSSMGMSMGMGMGMGKRLVRAVVGGAESATSTSTPAVAAGALLGVVVVVAAAVTATRALAQRGVAKNDGSGGDIDGNTLPSHHAPITSPLSGCDASQRHSDRVKDSHCCATNPSHVVVNTDSV